MSRCRGALIGCVLVAAGAFAPAAGAATITVETEADLVAADGECSLREAVSIANTNGAAVIDCEPGTGNDTILLGEGTYTLDAGPANEELNAGGDLDVLNSSNAPANDLTIQGAGDAVTEITAANLDRVIDVKSDGATSGVDVTVEAVSLRNGNVAGDGGAIRMADANGSITLDTASITGSDASGNGGGVAFIGAAAGPHPVSIIDSEFAGNTAASGGGVYAGTNSDTAGRSVLVTGSTFAQNSATGPGGAIAVAGVGGDTRLGVLNSTFKQNGTPGGGAVIWASGAAVVDVRFSTMDENHVYAQFPKGAAIQTNSDSAVVRLVGNIIYFNVVFPPPDFQGAESSCGEFGGGDGVFVAAVADYNVAFDAGCDLTGTGNVLGTFPGLDMLGDHGGPTRTRGLYDNSVALNQVPVASCTDLDGNPLTVDQRGEPRPLPAPDGLCDIGAFEGSVGPPGIGHVISDFGVPGGPQCKPKSDAKAPNRKSRKGKRKRKRAKPATSIPAPPQVDCGTTKKPKQKAKKKRKGKRKKSGR